LIRLRARKQERSIPSLFRSTYTSRSRTGPNAYEDWRNGPARGERPARVREIEHTGVTTLQGIADALNARGIRTARARRWYPSTVKNLLGRASAQVEQGEAA